jgi:hypothetical protein
MKTTYINNACTRTLLALGVLGLAACTNYFDEHFMDNGHTPVIDVRTNMTYTLVDNDYKLITTYQENIDKAIALDPVDSTGLKELQQIAKELSFTETASADMYVPAFMAATFPYLDNGTVCDVTYTMREGKSNRVQEFVGAQGFALTVDDYETIWQKRGANYLTPSTVPAIPDFLAVKLSSAKLGQIALLTYNFSEEEPDSSDLSDFLPYELTLSELLAFPDEKRHMIHGLVGDVKSSISGRFYMLDGDASIYVYGLTDEDGNKVWKDKGIQEGDSIVLIGRYSTESGEPQILDAVYVSHSTPAPAGAPRRAPQANKTEIINALYQLTADGWVLYANEQLKAGFALPQSVYDLAGTTQITDPEIITKYLYSAFPYPQDKEIYLVAYMGKNGATADEWVVDGTDFVLSTGYVNETMTFEVKNNAWVPNISTYLQAKFVGEGPGKFTIQHVALDGLNYIWRYQALYGMTASAYVSGTNHRVEDWLISPNIRLKKSVQPQLTFDHAIRYGNVVDNPKWLNVMVTDNYTGDVTTTEWKHLEWNVELPDGSNWIFRSAGVWDLSEYNGKTIVIAFRYDTNLDGIDVPSAPTWEIQNLLLAEPAEEEEKSEE